MSELIDNARNRRGVLKHLILQLHDGTAPEAVKPQLLKLLGRVPYSEVVAVEQELIADGMPVEEILDLCDLHSEAMKGLIDLSGAKEVPAGHPIETFKLENKALIGELELTDKLYSEIENLPANETASEQVGQLRVRFGLLSDIDKHYSRKENLVFPFLEKRGITGPPKVMWGKDDEVRAAVKGAVEALAASVTATAEEARGVIDLVLRPATEAIKEMIFKEEEILLPMCHDSLDEAEWYAVYQQSAEIGFCLIDPDQEWKPAGIVDETSKSIEEQAIKFPSGSLTPKEMEVLLNTIPFDLTFVGADDRVKYFTQGKERIFDRNRAIIGREVKLCHPPGSVHVVEKIIDDFRSGRQDSAAFWINLGPKFIHIEYFAMRDEKGEFLGTLEVSQNLTEKRALDGEQRLVSYEKRKSE